MHIARQTIYLQKKPLALITKKAYGDLAIGFNTLFNC